MTAEVEGGHWRFDVRNTGATMDAATLAAFGDAAAPEHASRDPFSRMRSGLRFAAQVRSVRRCKQQSALLHLARGTCAGALGRPRVPCFATAGTSTAAPTCSRAAWFRHPSAAHTLRSNRTKRW
jgi:hypothetical protein